MCRTGGLGCTWWPSRDHGMPTIAEGVPVSTADATIAVFVVIFVANFVAAVLPGWSPDPAISGGCTAVIGAALAARGRNNKRNGTA